MNFQIGRFLQAPVTNKSGGALAQGDVVIVDAGTAQAVDTTTTAAYIDGMVGVVLDPNGIANDAIGMVAFGGIVPKINLASSASLGDFVKTHTVAKQGTPHAAPMVSGDFAQVLGTGTSPIAVLFAVKSGAGIAVDPIWDAKGDLVAASAANTGGKLTLGTNGYVLTADSAQALGVKWAAAPASPWLNTTGTAVSITNDATEQTAYTFSVPGGTLSTNKALLLKVQARIVHSVSGTLTVRFKYGGTTLITLTVPEGASTADKSSDIWFLLAATGATNTQRASGRVDMQDAANSIRSRWNQEGTSAEDSTAAKTLAMTVQWGAASASLTYAQSWAGLQLLG